MLLSEMLGVNENTPFGVRGRVGHYKVNNNTLMRSFRCDDNWEVVSADIVLGILLYEVHSNIIHLPPPLTDEQREQLKAIWTLGGRWIAKDETGNVFAYDSKPQKIMICCHWNNDEDGECFTVMRELSVCSLVSWLDHEPYDIAKALNIKN